MILNGLIIREVEVVLEQLEQLELLELLVLV
jgi:hypothetical protein